MSPSPLEAALDKLLIADVWRLLGLDGNPPERDKSVRSPFRDDKNPSFSIFDHGKRWKDHGTGEHGNAADFLAKARNLSNGDACRELIRLAGTGVNANGNVAIGGHQASAAPPRAERKHVTARLPLTLPWSRDFAQRVADSRGLHITAVEFSFLWLKTLVFVRWCNAECWVLRDRSRRCMEARRIDREKFSASANCNERKAHVFAGYSDKSWPVGILPLGFEEPWLKQHCHKIMLVEGGPDYLAASQLIVESSATDFDNVLLVAILGASNNIAIDALHHFAQRETTIVAHGDDEGRAAGERWAKQIQRAGGRVKIFNLNQNKGDLCDIVAQGATNNELGLF
jgi:CHC2 zinc finger/Toprim-like